MKTIQPDMNLDKQMTKAIAAVNLAILECNLDKSRYTIALINEMVRSVIDGQPRPWSEFQPRIDEEFNWHGVQSDTLMTKYRGDTLDAMRP